MDKEQAIALAARMRLTNPSSLEPDPDQEAAMQRARELGGTWEELEAEEERQRAGTDPPK
ncbi:hypothetical protein [Streptomyces sp. CRN 30]|uniref:hypothetical protein n=1 Tax=Streptomyces sp. CRN 30 TaxID=3075613 RepID=UPI002A7FE7A4|nr:hypothetical protein [Streptomyces sp. CRN 30]